MMEVMSSSIPTVIGRRFLAFVLWVKDLEVWKRGESNERSMILYFGMKKSWRRSEGTINGLHSRIAARW